jgi:hypothetical protein
MADRVARWSGRTPVVTEFEFDENAFDDDEINAYRIDAYGEQWMDFIILNRNKSTRRKSVHEYDTVEGTVADDAVSIKIDACLDGMVSKSDFGEELNDSSPTVPIP